MINRRRSTEKRYAEHRRRKSDQMGCDFCEFANNSSQVVEERQYFWVVDNLFPYEIWDGHEVEHHLMVVPKRHVEGIGDFTDEERSEVINTIADYESRGYSVYARASINKQKTVPHQHTHLIKLTGKQKCFQLASRKPYILWTK